MAVFEKRSRPLYSRKKIADKLFFRWGRFYHHLFKVAVIILLMVVIFVLYRYFLHASYSFAAAAAAAAGIVLSGGKELLDKCITADDILVSILGIIIGFSLLLLFF